MFKAHALEEFVELAENGDDDYLSVSRRNHDDLHVDNT